MAAPQKVELAPSRWAEEFRPILARAATGKRGPRWLEGVIGAIERGDAVLFVARADGDAKGVLVLAFQKWPLASVYVLAMATAPRSGFAWGPALWPAVRDLAKRAGAETVHAEALSEGNRRRLVKLGFAPRSTMMVCPC